LTLLAHSSIGRATGCSGKGSSKRKRLDELIAKSGKPKEKSKAIPSKGIEKFLCVETLHDAPKSGNRYGEEKVHAT